MDLAAAINEWQSLLGAPQVLIGDAAQRAYGMDASGSERDIPAALRILNPVTLPDVMRIANRCRVPVYPISTGHNWGYGSALPARSGCVVLDLSALTRIVHFDSELGVVTVEPGVTQALLTEYLDAGGHPYMVPVTGAGPTCSLVGNALERGYGVTPHADHFGAVTNLEAVLADGTSYRTALHEIGGEDLARLYKWGIGPYSVGLFTQSGFGIVTRMTIALARRPDSIKVCLFSLRDDSLLEIATVRIRTILQRLPGVVGSINLMNRLRVLAMSAPFPADRLGDDELIPVGVVQALGRQYQVLPWTGFATLFGTARVVAAAQKEMRTALAGVGSRVMFLTLGQTRTLKAFADRLPGAAGGRLANSAATLASSLELVGGRPNETALPLAYWRNSRPPVGPWRDPSRDGCGLIWYAPLVPMRPHEVRTYVDMVKRITHQYRTEPLVTFTSISDKLFDSTVPILFDRLNPNELRSAWSCYHAMVDAGRDAGCFPYRLGVDAMHHFSAQATETGRFHERLRRAVDPNHVLAPGRYS